MMTEELNKNLIEELHFMYLDQQNGNLHDALKRFLKRQGIADPDQDPRTPPSEESLSESEKQMADLKHSYENGEISRMVYVEFDNGGYFQDPLIIHCVKVSPRTVSGIIKTHEGIYKKISISKNFYISNHMQTSTINRPKSLICESMQVWEKTKIHKNYQEFDYNFDYDFGDL